MNSQTRLINQSNESIIIDCGDIYLREFRREDVEDIYTISNQHVVSTFLPEWKSTKEQRLDWVSNYEIPANNDFLKAVSGNPEIQNHTLKLAIMLKESNEFIGWCCTGIKEELPPPNREVMYAVSEGYANNGYATKAAKGLITYLFEKTNIDHLIVLALPHNLASNIVIEKCGFSFDCKIELEKQIYNQFTLSKKG